MALTVTPSGPSSRASARVNATMPPLVETYESSIDQPPKKVIEVRLMIRPWPRSTIDG
jgi:hypothetical protein